jgi:hypothetical protein
MEEKRWKCAVETYAVCCGCGVSIEIDREREEEGEEEEGRAESPSLLSFILSDSERFSDFFPVMITQ